jgi:hypothetical protein
MDERTYRYEELDATEEVVKEMQKLRDQVLANYRKIEEINSKEKEDLSKPVPVDRPKKSKGFVMKKTLVTIVGLIVIFASLAYCGYVASDINYDIASNPELLQTYLRDVVANGFYTFTPKTAAPDASEGRVYYDGTAKALNLCTDGSTWTALDIGSAVSLDGAYNVGTTIDVDGDAVTLTTSDTDDNVVLAIVQNEATNDNGAVTITMGTGATGTGLAIDSQVGGTDISGDNWSVTQTGEIITAGDVLFNGTYDVAWDTSRNQFILEDSAVLGFGGDHDAAADITFTYDGSNNDLDIAFDDKEIAFGSDGAGGDVFFYGETASTYMEWCEDEDELLFDLADLKISQGSQIEFIDVTDGLTDWTIDNATDETLLIKPVETTDDQSINLGNADYTTDLRLFGKTASTVIFDASADKVIFDAYDIEVQDGDYIDFGDSLDFTMTATNKIFTWQDLQTDESSIINIGADQDGIDMKWFGATASAYTMWDASANQILLTGGSQLSLNDSVELLIGTGSSNAGDFKIYGTSTPTLVIDNVVADSGSIQIGLDDHDVPFKWFAETASSYFTFTGDQLIGDAVSIALGQGDYILFGDTLGTGDLKIGASANNVLSVLQTITDTGSMTYGVDGNGLDVTFYGEQVGDYLKWDATSASQLILNGADSSGTLFAITGIDTTGNTDTMTIAHSGTGAAIKITSSEADTQLLELVSAANQTTWLEVIDGATGNWIGADDVGMLTLKADTALAHAGATQLLVSNSAQPITASEGFLARFVDTGTAQTNAYAVEIEVTDTTGGLHVDGHSRFDKGVQASAQTVTATADGLTTGLIPNGASFITVSSDSAAKVVVLPTWVIGDVIRITVPATGAELQTLDSSNDAINGVDCDGTNEMAMTAGYIYELVCVADSKWIAYGWTDAGAAVATIVPDAD